MCIRAPQTSSNRSRICSRSRKQYQNIEIAPSSSAAVPSQTRCEWIRFSSHRQVRIHVAFGGVSRREQLLDREHEDELVVLEREVVDPLRVGDRLPPRLLLHVLLEAGVQVADHGLEPDDLLAVQVDDQAQHAVGGRVVGAEVDRLHVAGREHVRRDAQHRRAPGSGSACPRRSRRACARVRSPSLLRLREAHRLAADRVVLAQRMALPVVVDEDPRQVRMARRSGCPSCPRPRARASRRSARSRSRSAPARRRRPRPGRAPGAAGSATASRW